jgi:uncharacterized membrane protein YuzA (DUF378 family)
MSGPTATYINGEDKDTQYKLAFLYKLCIVLLVVGALNWLFTGVFGMNFVKIIFGEGWLAKTVYVLVGLAALYVMFDRNTYLPFLGPMVAPCAGLVDRVPPGANASVVVHVKPGAKVLYWAAEQPNGDALMSVNTWKEAYGEYSNTGVTTADYQGKAVLRVRRPQPYRVPIRGALKSHIHYRECGLSGWMGQVETVFLPAPAVTENDIQEGFDNALLSEVGGLNEGFTNQKDQENTNAMMVDLAGSF